MFPRVTYDEKEFTKITGVQLNGFYVEEHCSERTIWILHVTACASNIDDGLIWLSYPSAICLLHEVLHIIGWKLKMPLLWHKIIEKLL